MPKPIYDKSVLVVPLEHLKFQLFWSNRAKKDMSSEALVSVCFNSLNEQEMTYLIEMFGTERLLEQANVFYKTEQANNYLVEFIERVSDESKIY